MKKFKAFIDSLGAAAAMAKNSSSSILLKRMFITSPNYPEINEFYFVKEFVESQKLKGFVVGPDAELELV